nr:hypothetical protein [Tanacetum cinerariifolium]
MPKVLLLACDRVSEIKDAFGNKQYKPEDIQELFRKLFNDVQNIHEELAEYINTPGWNRPAFYNNVKENDEKYTIAITPVLPTKEPYNSLTLNENPTPDCVIKSPSPFPIPVKDSDSFFEKSDTSLSYLDNSLPEFETFSDHTEKTSSGSTTTHVDNSLPEYDLFFFEIEPNQGQLTSVVMEDILGEPYVHVPNVLPTHPTLMMDSDFIPSDDSLGSDLEVSFPSRTRNKIFDPGIFFQVQSKRFLS